MSYGVRYTAKLTLKKTALGMTAGLLLVGGALFSQNLLTTPATTHAVTPPDSCFAFNPGTGTITSYYNYEANDPANPACPKDVDIPSTIGGVGVASIGNRAFERKGLTSVTIPNGVMSIGIRAFYMNSLTSVTIPNSVTTIGNSAFSDNQLTAIILSSSLTNIGASAFLGNSLTSVTIPNSVTTIGTSAFSSNSLTSVTIPNSVTTIGDQAFYGNQLTSVTIPDSVTTIGSSAFSNNDLNSVTFNGDVATFGEGVLSGNAITSLTYDGVTYTPTNPINEACFEFSADTGTISSYRLFDMTFIEMRVLAASIGKSSFLMQLVEWR